MAAADPDVISSKSSDPEDELRDKFELGFDSNGVLRQYDNKSSEITERSFQFDVHSGDKKRNQERRISIKTMQWQFVFYNLHGHCELGQNNLYILHCFCRRDMKKSEK